MEVRRGAGVQVQRVSSAEVAALWRSEVASNPSLIAGLWTEPDAPYFRMDTRANSGSWTARSHDSPDRREDPCQRSEADEGRCRAPL